MSTMANYRKLIYQLEFICEKINAVKSSIDSYNKFFLDIELNNLNKQAVSLSSQIKILKIQLKEAGLFEYDL
jgi:hypothetical protein